jgi:hypothetical protein
MCGVIIVLLGVLVSYGLFKISEDLDDKEDK